MKYMGLVFMMCFLVGCLLTHKDIDELEQEEQEQEAEQKQPKSSKEKPKSPPPSSDSALDKTPLSMDIQPVERKALVALRLSQMAQNLRILRGQVDVLIKKQVDYDFQIQQLKTHLHRLEEQRNKTAQKLISSSPTPPSSSDTFQIATDFFQKQQWKQAIVYYEQYREKHRNGDKYKQATLQIGLCFQKLNMKKEAQVFFKEVINKFPKSVEAKKARTQLSYLKTL